MASEYTVSRLSVSRDLKLGAELPSDILAPIERDYTVATGFYCFETGYCPLWELELL